MLLAYIKMINEINSQEAFEKCPFSVQAWSQIKYSSNIRGLK